MRKITQEAVREFRNGRTFHKDNTSVELSPSGNVVVLKLHGNAIARYDKDNVKLTELPVGTRLHSQLNLEVHMNTTPNVLDPSTPMTENGIPVQVVKAISTILTGDRQALFDKMVKHAITMPNKSFYKDPQSCMYRDGKGGMCLVGCLIPDEMYHPTIEKKRAHMLLDNPPQGADVFFNEVQRAHDTSTSRFEMLNKLQELAQRHNLFMYSVPSRLPEWIGFGTRRVGMPPAMVMPYATPTSFDPNY